MLVIRKRPELSVVRLLTAAVPWLVMVTAACGTTAPAGSTTVPRIELLCVWPNIATHPNINMDMGSAILLSLIVELPLSPCKKPKAEIGSGKIRNRFHYVAGERIQQIYYWKQGRGREKMNQSAPKNDF